jgi:hypothetical protein
MSDRIAPRRLYLTDDKTEVVGEGDERAAFLLAGEGCLIPGDFDGEIPAELLEPVAEPEVVLAEIVETSDELVVEAEKPEPAPAAKKRTRATADTAEAADTEE